MSITLKSLLRRQGQCSGGECFSSSPSAATTSSESSNYDTDTDDDYWPDSNAANVVRYVIVVVLILLVVLWVTFGIWHANRRLKRGQPPLWYHRWLVPSRRLRAVQQQQQGWPHQGQPQYDPNIGTYGGPPPGQIYQMHDWQRPEHAPPPPVYTSDSPPTYVPPPGPPPGREPKTDNAPAATVTPVVGASTVHREPTSPQAGYGSHTTNSNTSHAQPVSPL